MTQITARIKKGNSHFEILVDMDAALKFRKLSWK
jgi:ribosome maturation protein Sdo1